MAEIKSTLDLVMERTRHLSLTDEEKNRQQKALFDKRLQGLLHQYADGALTVNAVRDRIAALQAELGDHGTSALAAGIVRCIDPDRDNRIWMELLAAFVPTAIQAAEETLCGYGERYDRLLREAEIRLREHLARDEGISGSAVLPNPLKDPACCTAVAHAKQQALSDLRAIVLKGRSSIHT